MKLKGWRSVERSAYERVVRELAEANKRIEFLADSSLEYKGLVEVKVLYEERARSAKLIEALREIAAMDGLMYKGNVIERRDSCAVARDAIREWEGK